MTGIFLSFRELQSKKDTIKRHPRIIKVQKDFQGRRPKADWVVDHYWGLRKVKNAFFDVKSIVKHCGTRNSPVEWHKKLSTGRNSSISFEKWEKNLRRLISAMQWSFYIWTWKILVNLPGSFFGPETFSKRHKVNGEIQTNWEEFLKNNLIRCTNWRIGANWFSLTSTDMRKSNGVAGSVLAVIRSYSMW